MKEAHCEMALNATYGQSDGLYDVVIDTPLVLTRRETRKLANCLCDVGCDDIGGELMNLVEAHERKMRRGVKAADLARGAAASPER